MLLANPEYKRQMKRIKKEAAVSNSTLSRGSHKSSKKQVRLPLSQVNREDAASVSSRDSASDHSSQRGR